MSREDLQRQAEAEEELLSIYLMGDVREDAQFMGLGLKDIGWIIGTTLTMGIVPFLLPFSFWFKFVWLIGVFLYSFFGRIFRWPYRRKRYFHDKRQPKSGDGEQIADVLAMEEDSWFYVTGSKQQKPTVQLLYSIQAPPWSTAVLSQKRQRIAAFGQFIRAAAKEGFSVDVSMEQIPDYQHEIWTQKEQAPSDSEGIDHLKKMRIGMWRELARSGEAKRSAYVLRLTIDRSRIVGKQRDDEPADLSKEELKRFRFVADLRERQGRVMSVLSSSGHPYSLLSGYVAPELIGRWWDRLAWERWTDAQESWEDPEVEELGEELALVKLETDSEEALPAAEVTVQAKPLKRLLAFILQGMQNIRKGIMLILRFLSRGWPKRKKPEEKSEGQTALAPKNDSEVPEPVMELTPGIRILTSPVPSGKTFLAVNVGAAWSSHESPVHIVDLSPDQGCKTALNPLPITCREPGWTSFVSRHAPGLTLWVPEPGTTDTLSDLLQNLGQTSPVLVDMPWRYPDREDLLQLGTAVAVVDGDYHHWLGFEQTVPTWDGEVWLNGVDEDMEKAMKTLIQDHWDPAAIHVFPVIDGAQKWLYQGLPPASDPDIRSQLRKVGEGGECA